MVDSRCTYHRRLCRPRTTKTRALGDRGREGSSYNLRKSKKERRRREAKPPLFTANCIKVRARAGAGGADGRHGSCLTLLPQCKPALNIVSIQLQYSKVTAGHDVTLLTTQCSRRRDVQRYKRSQLYSSARASDGCFLPSFPSPPPLVRARAGAHCAKCVFFCSLPNAEN